MRMGTKTSAWEKDKMNQNNNFYKEEGDMNENSNFCMEQKEKIEDHNFCMKEIWNEQEYQL